MSLSTLEDLGIVYFFSVKDKNYINTTGQTLRSWVVFFLKQLGGNKESIERVLEEKILHLVSVTGKKNDRIAKGYQ